MLADPYDAILLDLDGVLYRWPEAIAGAPEAVERLRNAGKGLAFVTNNASRTPAQVAERLASVGVMAVAEAEVATSALATATVLASRGVRSAFVVGEEGLVDALAEEGIGVADGAGRPDAVVVGFDRHVDYDKLKDASVLVASGVPLIASNADASFPAPGGEAWPGAGALVAAIERTTGARAEVVGKPEAPLLERALEAAGGGRPLVVGDRLDTDIAGAVRLGWDSVLVLSGVATAADVDGSPWQPTFVVESLAQVAEPTGPEDARVS